MNYAKLRGKIKEVYGIQSDFARAMRMNPATLSFKLNGNTPWKREEIELACQLLYIPLEEAYLYFFNRKIKISK